MQKTITALSISLGLIISALPTFASTADINVNKLANTFVSETQGLKPQVARTALTAYQNALKKGIKDNKGIITVIDYSMPSTAKRMWVLNVNTQKVLFNTLVAHGKNSGANYATTFSNKRNSDETSLGLYQTANVYHGHDGLAIRLNGLDKGYNSNAMVRDVVIHGATYVSQSFAKAQGRIGRSWGCPAVSKKMIKPIINTIKGGTLVLAYYPSHSWLANSVYL